MRTFLCLLLSLVLLHPTAALAADPPAAPAEKGWVVLSMVGATGNIPKMTIRVRRQGESEGFEQEVDVSGWFGNPEIKEGRGAPPSVRPALASRGLRYFKSAYKGKVRVFSLPPGAYEIYGMAAEHLAPTGQGVNLVDRQVWESIALPFDVRAGRTTYLGELRWLELEPAKGLIKPFAGWSVVVGDRSDRDLALARSKTPTLGEVDMQVLPADAPAHPFLSATP